MERLKHVKDTLLCAVESQLGDLSHVDAKELGEVVDMVKDMEEAMYYCSIVKAMEKQEEEEEKYPERRHYMPMHVYRPEMEYGDRDMDRHMGRMYYSGRTGMEMSHERMEDRYPMEIRDVREGKSPISRKNYMESKELHKGTPVQMKELEKYLKELTEDLTEMIEDASPEEKAVLQQKLSMLASKIK